VDQNARIFICYSRKDEKFTGWLAESLTGRGYIADFDRSARDPRNVETGIAADEEWWCRLKEMIAQAETVIFVVSPDSIKSPVCDGEIGFAQECSKRIVPLLFRNVNLKRAPPRLASLNIKLDFRQRKHWTRGLDDLALVLTTDLRWHREGARLLGLALAWQRSGLQEALLLPLGSVDEADRWISTRPKGAAPLSDVLLQFVSASREQAIAARRKLQVVSARAHAEPARRAVEDDNPDLALQFALAGALASQDAAFELAPELFHAVSHVPFQISSSRRRIAIEKSIDDVCWSRDGSRLLVCDGGHASVIDAVTLDVERKLDGVRRATFAPSAELVVTLGRETRVSSVRTGTVLIELPNWQDRNVISFRKGEQHAVVLNARFDPDGTASRATVIDVDGGKLIKVLVDTPKKPIGDNVLHGRVLKLTMDESNPLFASSVEWARYTDDGARLVTISTYGRAQVWNSASLALERSITSPSGAYTVADTSADGLKFMMADTAKRMIFVWCLETGQELCRISGVDGLVDASFFGKGLVALCADRVRLYETSTGSPTLDAVMPGAKRLQMNRQEHNILKAFPNAQVADQFCVYSDGPRLRARAFSGENVVLACFDSAIEGVWLEPSARRCAALTKGGLHVVDIDAARFVPCAIQSWAPTPLKNARRDWLGCLDADLTGSTVVASANEGDFRVFGWDGARLQERARLGGHAGRIIGLSLSADGARALSAADDSVIRLWDVRSGKMEREVTGRHGLTSAMLSADGTKIALSRTRDGGGDAEVLDAMSGQSLSHEGGRDNETAFAGLSPDNRYLLQRDDYHGAPIWMCGWTDRAVTAPVQEQLPRHSFPSSVACSFSPDGQLVAILDRSGAVSLYDVATQQTVWRTREGVGAHGLCFSADGRWISAPKPLEGFVVLDARRGLVLASTCGPRVAAVRFVNFDNVVTLDVTGALRIYNVSAVCAFDGDPLAYLMNAAGRDACIVAERDRGDLILQSAPVELGKAIAQRWPSEANLVKV